ncbi:hypothetical protein CPAST_c27350 [Clostridium pasteurianum DSM 525 = ATCC 6013]|uniref:Uncharacterized protein n=1 Tax=Clostridium pasteurianum DSM 525 = ATCC 6013 TaxID=1262449 RepID=A0A0H3J6I5_CLOPA|nr:hypothetical protein CPAST_c27350 [Clostridium pasteurianum DSM 525 = ATCC 6013]AJA52790.1 hypothetical protein CLPA_c27350 [Clostridium pasteurianum DSM 525 = ATCC 6013]KRU11202.1 hypothetical protein CP6013_00449 [Clostridium pasteurianum DSM 525 = ATCC 6013]
MLTSTVVTYCANKLFPNCSTNKHSADVDYEISFSKQKLPNF